MGQDFQPFYLIQQGINGNNHAAAGSAQLINAVASHIHRFGESAIKAVFDGDGLHIGVIRAHVWAGQVEIQVVMNEVGKAAHHGDVLRW